MRASRRKRSLARQLMHGAIRPESRCRGTLPDVQGGWFLAALIDARQRQLLSHSARWWKNSTLRHRRGGNIGLFLQQTMHFTRSSGPLARLTSSQRCAAQDCQEFRMGDNSFLSPAFIILVIGVIAVVLFLVTRAKKKRNKK
ncbi:MULTISPECIES: hypothetical protein [Xanthomonas]|uniref:hypothetical protein n=1 Tax=Xanthomonas TaxID=338 RepID=UPI0013B3AE3E|nr:MULTISPECIES: hypothetical protein [Xanthomonas]QTD88030.1 hypothetical protein XcfCFBP6988P_23710 [Xanthomonas citri pv. phaseoli var. fuscans]QTF14105.1 hypothetical protein XcfCFBP6989P_23620 [Xanthomonas citri pv. phaseoli var. fuscans]QTF14330.1 hypothetical protein XcfCFBP6991P_24365 [Xanthomonas citri pv. phaseoli var. fuscans]QTF76306.1 hypothetical protein XcfCFBP6990P_23650 [Xanthomonas citri pv. phaseoli var. fuscans]UZB01959.1 hypothetical protein OM946_15925 [Xanthomonas citri 